MNIKSANEILFTAREIHSLGFLAACDGNISQRTSPTQIMITPSGVAKHRISKTDLCMIPTLENRYEQTTGASSESIMHQYVYHYAPEARAVIHAHPPYSIALSLTLNDAVEFPKEHLSELILACGSIPIVPYARPGSEQMGENLVGFLPSYKVMVLKHHGALTWGDSIEEALLGLERLEHTAKILHLAYQLRKPQTLPQEEIDALVKMRQAIHPKTL